jgi:hypothetical protein
MSHGLDDEFPWSLKPKIWELRENFSCYLRGDSERTATRYQDRPLEEEPFSLTECPENQHSE